MAALIVLACAYLAGFLTQAMLETQRRQRRFERDWQQLEHWQYLDRELDERRQRRTRLGLAPDPDAEQENLERRQERRR